MTVAAIAALVLRAANADSAIARAAIYALATLAATFGLFAVLFVIAWFPAVIGRDPWEDVNRGSPFAAQQLPPQVLPPRDSNQ